MNINELYNLVLDLSSKNNGQYISPSEFNRYVKVANKEYFDKRFGKNNQPATVYGRDRTHDSNLRLFRKVETINLVDGVGELPADWEKTNALHTVGDNPIVIVETDEDRLARRFDSPIDQPTEEFPMYIQNDLTIEVYPKTITSATLRYLRTPATPVWNYTVTGRKPVYDPITSVDPEWPDSDLFDLANRILQLLGVSMSNNNLINFTENKQTQE